MRKMHLFEEIPVDLLLDSDVIIFCFKVKQFANNNCIIK